ncbi:MAG: polymerase [Betaproteobacteria bacterium HGW-Betaproteobacteria-18]|nr:MAG: polymerase [Betaproteobacteria bacterium HGW-Betaproteobacteria-18]
MAAASAGLSIAVISLGKLLLLVSALVVLLRGKQGTAEDSPWQSLWTPRLILVILLAFAGSLLWTSAPMDQALGAVGKYGKFLVIPALLVLLGTRREAAFALAAFVGAQAFLLLSSWLLYFYVPVVWATASYAKDSFAVFSSYLDQGIMSAVVAAIFWHLKALAPNRPLFYAAIAMSLLALGNVFIVFTGRTGHLVGLAMVSLAIFWALPRRYRLASLVVPPLIFILAFFSFDKVAQRFSAAQTEVSAYALQPESKTSSGIRLYIWQASLAAIAKNPLTGTGVGSWVTEYNRLEYLKPPSHQRLVIGNPHQEYLLWGVQLGVGGILLLLAFLAAVMLDFLKMDTPIAKAGQSVLAALAVSCLFNSSLYDAYIGDFFCLSLGVLLAYGIHGQDILKIREL